MSNYIPTFGDASVDLLRCTQYEYPNETFDMFLNHSKKILKIYDQKFESELKPVYKILKKLDKPPTDKQNRNILLKQASDMLIALWLKYQYIPKD